MRQVEQKKRDDLRERNRSSRLAREKAPPTRAFGSVFSKTAMTSRAVAAASSSSSTMAKMTASLASLAVQSSQAQARAHTPTPSSSSAIADELVEKRRRETELKQLSYLRRLLTSLETDMDARAEKELSVAWRTVHDAEEEATSLALKAQHVAGIMNIHKRLSRLDAALEIARAAIIAVSTKHLHPLEQLGEHLQAHITLEGRDAPKWDSSEEGVERVVGQVEALKAALERFPASLAGHQLNVNGEVATQKYSLQRRLNELQTSVMMNLRNKLTAAEEAEQLKAARSPARSPYVSPYASPRRKGTKAKAKGAQ